MFATQPHPTLLPSNPYMWPTLLSRLAGRGDQTDPAPHVSKSKTSRKIWNTPAWLASKKDKESTTPSRPSRIRRLALRAKGLVTLHSSPKEQPRNALIALASPTPSELSALSPPLRPEVSDQPSLDPMVRTEIDTLTSSATRHGSLCVSTVPPQTIPGPAASTLSIPSSEDSPLLIPSINPTNASDALTSGLSTEPIPLISVTSPRSMTSVGFILRMAPTQFPASTSLINDQFLDQFLDPTHSAAIE